eukprot:11775688-Alexandrium_andersonii.AAC.1
MGAARTSAPTGESAGTSAAGRATPSLRGPEKRPRRLGRDAEEGRRGQWRQAEAEVRGGGCASA